MEGKTRRNGTAAQARVRHEYTVYFEPQSDGSYSVVFPSIPEIVTFGTTLNEARRIAAELELHPERYIVQPIVPLSRHPTVVDGRLVRLLHAADPFEEAEESLRREGVRRAVVTAVCKRHPPCMTAGMRIVIILAFLATFSWPFLQSDFTPMAIRWRDAFLLPTR